MIVCGIYRILNTANGKLYIGSSANVYSRWVAHRSNLRRGVHHSRQLQRAWNKYGEAAFVFEIVAECDVPELERLENFHIQSTRSMLPAHGYNHAPVAGSTRGIKLGPMPEAHRRKIAEAKLGKPASAESKRNQSAARKGRDLSPEWRAKIAAANVGRKMAPLSDEHRAIVSRTHKGKTISDEHKRRISEAQRGRKQSPEMVAKRMASKAATIAARKASREQQCCAQPARILSGM